MMSVRQYLETTIRGEMLPDHVAECISDVQFDAPLILITDESPMLKAIPAV